MAGHASGAHSLTRVRVWVAERAALLGWPMSAGLLCETAVARLAVSGAALMLETSTGWHETREATDPVAERLAQLQLTVGEGPCLDAGRAGGPVFAADLDTCASQRRWPMFAPLAVEAGARAVFALPMCVGAIRVGVLTLHRALPGQLEASRIADALAFAELALMLLLDEQAGLPPGADDPSTVDGLPLHNAQVHQATGMISVQLGLPMADAFARLRARAFADQRTLTELAADVVARRQHFNRPDEAS